MSQIAEQMLIHLLKMLNIYSHLLEEVPLSKVASSTATATATALLPLSLPSPIKKQDKKMDKEEKFEDRKPKSFSSYRQTPQYFKLYQLLKNAHTNYKVSLKDLEDQIFLWRKKNLCQLKGIFFPKYLKKFISDIFGNIRER